MLRINDEQIVEGILGGLGFVVFFIYWRSIAKLSTELEGYLAWIFVWWVRKLGMNFYKKYKLNKQLIYFKII
jgi:hypothetical protein